MGLEAGVVVTFYDKNNKRLERNSIDCYKCCANGDTFNIPVGSETVKVYFSTEDDLYSDDDDYSVNDEEDDEFFDEEMSESSICDGDETTTTEASEKKQDISPTATTETI